MADVADPQRTNLARMLEPHDSDRVAVISRGTETTYGELRDLIDHLRGGLAGEGIGIGDRVAILCGNNRYFVKAYFATVGLGAVAIPLNPASPAPEIERQLEVIRPNIVIVGPSAMSSWSQVDPELVAAIDTVVIAEGEAPAGTRSLTDLAAGRAGSDRRCRARPRRRHAVHQWHCGPAQGGDAEPPQSDIEHRTRPAPPAITSTKVMSSTASCRCSTSSVSTWCSGSR